MKNFVLSTALIAMGSLAALPVHAEVNNNGDNSVNTEARDGSSLANGANAASQHDNSQLVTGTGGSVQHDNSEATTGAQGIAQHDNSQASTGTQGIAQRDNSVGNSGAQGAALHDNSQANTGTQGVAQRDNSVANTGAQGAALHDNSQASTGTQGVAQRDNSQAVTGAGGVVMHDNSQAATGAGAIAQRDNNTNTMGNASGTDAQAFENASNLAAASDHSIALSNSPNSSVSEEALSGAVTGNTVTVGAGTPTNAGGGSTIPVIAGSIGAGAFASTAGITQVSQNVGNNVLTQQGVSFSVNGLQTAANGSTPGINNQ